jgi:dolichol-phosphate mannosyltransferase
MLRFSRRFGQPMATLAGLEAAGGDAVVVIDCDLQDPPEVIPEFIAKWEEGYDHVHGIVTARTGTGPIRRMNSNLFYLIAGKLTDGRIPRNVSDFRLIDRSIVDTINRMEERNRFMRGLFSWVGFKTTGVEHERVPRHAGESKAYTFGVLGFAVRGILAHSYVPLRIISGVGMALSGVSAIALVVLTLRFILVGVPFPGFGTLICVMILLFGILFSILGVLAEYLGLIYEEVKQRPNYVVREELGFTSDAYLDRRTGPAHPIAAAVLSRR